MTTRIAVIGNCHAQYLAAALHVYFPECEVKAVGRLFDGPISFQGKSAHFTTLEKAKRWLKGGEGTNFIISQTTPLSKYNIEEQLDDGSGKVKFIRFPYIMFKAFNFKRVEPDVKPALINATIRADEMSNLMSMAKAGIDEDRLEEILEIVREHPHTYTRNHFTGYLFSKVFSIADWTSFAEDVGPKKLDGFFEAMKGDAGICHTQSGIPNEIVAKSMGLKWTETVNATIEPFLSMPMDEFVAYDWSKDPFMEYYYYALFRTFDARSKKEKGYNSLLKCFVMYRNNRQYVIWCRNIATAFLTRNRPDLAARVLAARMSNDDTRGLLLSWILERVPQLRGSAKGRKDFKSAADAAPDSNAKIVSDILEALS